MRKLQSRRPCRRLYAKAIVARSIDGTGFQKQLREERDMTQYGKGEYSKVDIDGLSVCRNLRRGA